MNYTELALDNNFQKWFKYQPLDAQIVRYAKNNSSVIAAGLKIMDVYYAFANAKQSFRSAGYENYGDLCGNNEISKLYTRCHFLIYAVLEYNLCLDLCLQVIWAYIQPSSLESLAQNQYKDIEKECTSEIVHKTINQLIKEGRTDLKPLKKLLGKLESHKDIKELRNLCNYLKHRGTIHFDGLGDNLEHMLMPVNGQFVKTLSRDSYTCETVEQILWNYHKKFQEYFDQIIEMIIPDDYSDNTVLVKDYSNTLFEMMRIQKKN